MEMIINKKCFKCGEIKSIVDFYQHSGMKDGHLNKCKKCTRNDSKKDFEKRKSDSEWTEKERSRHREKYHRLNYKEKHKPSAEYRRKNQDNYRMRYPEKHKAKSRSGKLKAKFKGNHLHHWSYNDEHFKDVIELSERDHNILHRHTIYDQERKMYRDVNGMLLDSRYSTLKLCLVLGLILMDEDKDMLECW